MANDNKTNQAKVEVNGDAQALEPTRQQQITAALAHNGGLKRVEAKLRQGFDESGFSQTVKEYATQLLRSGEVTTFPELEEKIWQHVNANSHGKTANDSTASVPAPNLAVPQLALNDGATQVKKELAEILVTKKTVKDGAITSATKTDHNNGTDSVDNADRDGIDGDVPRSDHSGTNAAGINTTDEDSTANDIDGRGAPQRDITDGKASAENASNRKAAIKTTEDTFEAIQIEAKTRPGSKRQRRSKKAGTSKDLP